MRPTRSLSPYILLLLLFIFPVDLFAEGAKGPVAGKGRFVIDSDTMEVVSEDEDDGEGNLIIFKGKVVTREEFTLCSDELRVTYNDANEIKEIVAIGSVRLLQNGRVATAGRAEYDKEKRVIVFLDAPKISQCGDMVSGSKITYNMDSESAFIEGGEGGRVRALMISEKECVEEKIVEENFCTGAR